MPTGRMLLYTPASVMTSARVKQAMLQDYGSKGSTFLNTVASIRREVLHISGAQSSEWTVVPMQGNATIGLEATLGSVVPRGGKCCLVIRNGSCGTRMLRICERLAIPTIDVCLDEVTEMDLHHIEKVLKTHAKSISSVGMVHCETSTGQLNPVAAVGSIIRARVADATFIVDATSSFGGVPLSVPETHCDYLITSCNRSLQCVPGFSLVLARRAHERVVEDSNKSNRQKGCTLPRSFALDLWSQHKHMEERGGEFHATPPVHAMMAFQEALEELKLEGGVVQRAARYQRNTHRLLSGMMRLGFHPFLDPNMSTFGHIATAFRYPNHPAWCFDTFCAKLTEEKCYIHPRSLTCREPTFRVGSIGDIHPCDMEYLLVCVKKVMNLMGLESMRENPVVQYTPPAGKYPNPGKKVI